MPGAHITSVGYNQASREVDNATVADAGLCGVPGSSISSVPVGSNDLLLTIRDGVITAAHVHAELGELITAIRPGRSSPDQITSTSPSV